MNEQQNQQAAQPIAHARNIFEGINQNIVEMSKDYVEMYNLLKGMAVKVEAIYAALYQPIPENSPNDPGEGEGSENE
ncbi:MAG: hypothetical protein NC324_02970 [Bacteroides sp.]|nr:hypothetical protein [Bacteroides sp.]